jgi:hypothetical protein
LKLLPSFWSQETLVQDLLELAVWEDYGLMEEMNGFLSALPVAQANSALKQLARIVAELRREDLEHQLRKAIALREVVMSSAGAGETEESSGNT